MYDKNRIIFVGVHNKPNTPPLDSSTKSGKLIDRIIERIDCEALKTNLFDVEYYPKNISERVSLVQKWADTHNPQKNDVIVILGGLVRKSFPLLHYPQPIYIHHPSSVWSKTAKAVYVKNTVSIIHNILNNMNVKAFTV